MQKEEVVHRFWIFQGMPERYDLEEKLIPGESETWTLTRYHEEVKPGDMVYFWRGGRQSGLYGWGLVTDPPHQDQSTESRAAWWVNVTYQSRFKNPISKEDITGCRQADKLAGLLIFRAPQGTNFKVTTKEAISLNQLISERSESPPDNPTGAESSRFPVGSLAPLNFGKTVTLLIGAGLRFSEETRQPELDGEVLLSVLLALDVSSKGPPAGTVPFLAKFFSGLDVENTYLNALGNPVILSGLAADFFINDEVLDILESARLLAIYSTRKEQISVRHFLAGLLLTCKDRTLEHFSELANSVKISLGDLVEQFIKNTISSFEHDDQSLWMSQFRAGMRDRLDILEKRQLKKKHEEKKGAKIVKKSADFDVATKAGEFMQVELKSDGEDVETAERALAIAFAGRPVPDRPFGADLLRIDSEVDAMAHLFALCDDDVNKDGDSGRATFALGLFGRWGSGKSFFIEKLKKKIKELSNSNDSSKSLYCNEIISIDFNAWHYNEANIWASLVHHIFNTLQKHFHVLEKEKEFKNLIRQLEISQERREQLNKIIGEKRKEKKELEDTINGKEKEIESTIEKELESISSLPERLALNSKARDKLLDLLPQVTNILGLPTEEMNRQLQGGKQNSTELITVLKESGAMVGRGQFISKTILRSGLSKGFILVTGSVLLVYFALPVWLDKADLWNQLLTETGQVIALLTPALIWLRDKLTKSSNLFSQVAGVEAMLREDMHTEEKQKNKALITLRMKQKRLASDITDTSEKKDQLDMEIQGLMSKLDDLGSAESLVDYINDRASSDDYRSQLGILALVRRDFEKLSNLMTGLNKVKSPQTNSNQLNTADSANKLPHIDRIILYIDDLDRVQDSKKVLQVLEAVHLLLAFPLFHVVVAVDERWAARSVLSHHSDFFGIKAVANNSADDSINQEKASLLNLIGAQQATPREFLEKIFQISFWVRPLTSQLTENLIEGVVTKKRPGTKQVVKQVNHSLPADKDKASVVSTVGNNTVEQSHKNDNQHVLVNNTSNTKMTAQSASTAKREAKLKNKQQDNQQNVEESSKSTQINFEITTEELTSMRALANVIGRSPRTVKRFINTYRLFKAMNMPPGEGAWEDESGNNYISKEHVPIMILLSVQIGYPDIAVHFFEKVDNALSEQDSRSFGELIIDWENDTPKSDAEKHKWQHALNALYSVHDLYGDVSSIKELTISTLDPWLLATSRFGFQEWVPKVI